MATYYLLLGICSLFYDRLLCRANTDPVLYYQTQDKWIKEYWVHVEYMKMLKEEVRNCYRREGVNHYENCRDVVQEYYKRTKAPSEFLLLCCVSYHAALRTDGVWILSCTITLLTVPAAAISVQVEVGEQPTY